MNELNRYLKLENSMSFIALKISTWIKSKADCFVFLGNSNFMKLEILKPIHVSKLKLIHFDIKFRNLKKLEFDKVRARSIPIL